MVTLYDNLKRETVLTYSLVLDAAGIGNRVVSAGDRFCLDVPAPFAAAAQAAIARYRQENPVPEKRVSTPETSIGPAHLSGLAVALVLLCIHLAVVNSNAPEAYTAAFGADARRIVAGEIDRCVTALLLHADDAHLVGNMAAIALFGGAVCVHAGVGLGWLMILASGAAGNWINAWVYPGSHLSIGASTAIFGAVGLLCTSQALRAARAQGRWRPLLLSFGAGIALLAFLGVGPRSDLGAHLFGFLCGVALGLVCGLKPRWPAWGAWQALGLLLAAGILILAWLLGANRG